MKKFFLFRREQITLISSRSSNDGEGLSVIALPSDKLSFMTATLGKVHFTFDDASIYDYANIKDSTVIDKTSVSVSCQDGQEVELMESVMNFISNNNKEVILRFDSVEKESSSKSARVEGFKDVSAIVNSTPINVNTSKIEDSTAVIAGIDFLDPVNYPDIDYNHEALSSYSTGQHISAWANDSNALLGATYDLTDQGASNTLAQESGTTSYLTVNSANVLAGNYFRLGEEYSTSRDYTMYLSFGFPSYSSMYEFYGSFDGTCFGISKGVPDLFYLAHQPNTGLPASQHTNTVDNNTVDYKFPDPGLQDNPSDYQSVYSFVVRRDKDYNIYLYNFRGDIVSIIPAKTGGTYGTAGRTDGALAIRSIAGYRSQYLWKGFLCRFGVISRDVGNETCKNIAKDMYELYAYNYSNIN